MRNMSNLAGHKIALSMDVVIKFASLLLHVAELAKLSTYSFPLTYPTGNLLTLKLN